MVPVEIDIEALHTEEDWAKLELPETHILWDFDESESPITRSKRIEKIVSDLWDIAFAWTRAHPTWCDFQLIGYGADEEILFDDGRRCRVDCEFDDDDDGDSERWTPPSSAALEAERKYSERLEQVIDYTKTDRDDAVNRARQTMANNHQLWNEANAAVRKAIEYQQEQVERTRLLNSGIVELKAKAVAEIEETRRTKMIADLGKYVFDATISNVLPFLSNITEMVTNRRMDVYPQYRCAQQAMAYLAITFTQTQLRHLWGENTEAAGAFWGQFEQAAQIKDERKALKTIAPLLRLLNGELFRDIATHEQNIAVAYIIGRLAIYKIAEYGDVPEDPEEPAHARSR